MELTSKRKRKHKRFVNAKCVESIQPQSFTLEILYRLPRFSMMKMSRKEESEPTRRPLEMENEPSIPAIGLYRSATDLRVGMLP